MATEFKNDGVGLDELIDKWGYPRNSKSAKSNGRVSYSIYTKGYAFYLNKSGEVTDYILAEGVGDYKCQKCGGKYVRQSQSNQLTLGQIITLANLGRDHISPYTNEDRHKLYGQIKEVIGTCQSPSRLQQLVVTAMNYNSPPQCEGPICLICDEIFDTYAHCLNRLKQLDTNESIRTLVYLRINKDCGWDASASVLLSNIITRSGPKAIPYLKEIQPSYPDAKDLISLIKLGRLYGP